MKLSRRDVVKVFVRGALAAPTGIHLIDIMRPYLAGPLSMVSDALIDSAIRPFNSEEKLPVYKILEVPDAASFEKYILSVEVTSDVSGSISDYLTYLPERRRAELLDLSIDYMTANWDEELPAVRLVAAFLTAREADLRDKTNVVQHLRKLGKRCVETQGAVPQGESILFLLNKLGHHDLYSEYLRTSISSRHWQDQTYADLVSFYGSKELGYQTIREYLVDDRRRELSRAHDVSRAIAHLRGLKDDEKRLEAENGSGRASSTVSRALASLHSDPSIVWLAEREFAKALKPR